jgi:hypothetical protein
MFLHINFLSVRFYMKKWNLHTMTGKFWIQSTSVISTTLGDKKSVLITGRCLYWVINLEVLLCLGSKNPVLIMNRCLYSVVLITGIDCRINLQKGIFTSSKNSPKKLHKREPTNSFAQKDPNFLVSKKKSKQPRGNNPILLIQTNTNLQISLFHYKNARFVLYSALRFHLSKNKHKTWFFWRHFFHTQIHTYLHVIFNPRKFLAPSRWIFLCFKIFYILYFFHTVEPRYSANLDWMR